MSSLNNDVLVFQQTKTSSRTISAIMDEQGRQVGHVETGGSTPGECSRDRGADRVRRSGNPVLRVKDTMTLGRDRMEIVDGRGGRWRPLVKRISFLRTRITLDLQGEELNLEGNIWGFEFQMSGRARHGDGLAAVVRRGQRLPGDVDLFTTPRAAPDPPPALRAHRVGSRPRPHPGEGEQELRAVAGSPAIRPGQHAGETRQEIAAAPCRLLLDEPAGQLCRHLGGPATGIEPGLPEGRGAGPPLIEDEIGEYRVERTGQLAGRAFLECRDHRRPVLLELLPARLEISLSAVVSDIVSPRAW